jgi:ABC-type polar amino acid transport system ATPase subunit
MICFDLFCPGAKAGRLSQIGQRVPTAYDIKRRAAAMLAKVGLADKAASYPSALSGGQQ